MQTQRYEYKTDFAREHFFRGWREGWRGGQLTASRGAVLRVLDARGLVVSSDDRTRIEGEADVAALEGWQVRALRVATATDVFEAEKS